MKPIYFILFLLSQNILANTHKQFCKEVLKKMKSNDLNFNYTSQEISKMKFCDYNGHNLLHQWAMYSKSMDWALFLINRVNISPEEDAPKCNCIGRIPLMVAVSCSNINAVRIMLELNPKLVNRQDLAGWTALNWAIIAKNQEIVELLIRFGAEITHKDINGYEAKNYCESRKIKKLLRKKEKKIKKLNKK
jgi:ankyrin repeat protein